MPHEAFRCDLGHCLVRIVNSLPAAVAQREGQSLGNLIGRSGSENLRVGHAPKLAQYPEHIKNKGARNQTCSTAGEAVIAGSALSRWATRRMISAVSASAGRNASIVSSETVISTGVPNSVVVLKNDNTPSIVASRSGIATTPVSASSQVPASRGMGSHEFPRAGRSISDRRSDRSAGADGQLHARATGPD